MTQRFTSILLYSFSLLFAGMGIGTVIPSIINGRHLSPEESLVGLVVLVFMGISGFSAVVVSSIRYE